MKTYRVFWEIDIEADSPRQAAQQALEIQRDHKSIATVFDVREPSGNHIAFDLRVSLPINGERAIAKLQARHKARN